MFGTSGLTIEPLAFIRSPFPETPYFRIRAPSLIQAVKQAGGRFLSSEGTLDDVTYKVLILFTGEYLEVYLDPILGHERGAMLH